MCNVAILDDRPVRPQIYSGVPGFGPAVLDGESPDGGGIGQDGNDITAHAAVDNGKTGSVPLEAQGFVHWNDDVLCVGVGMYPYGITGSSLAYGGGDGGIRLAGSHVDHVPVSGGP